jgi:hypothetical protein
MVAMTPKALRTKINKLQIAAPVTESYGKTLAVLEIWGNKEVWYSSQKEHWMQWLLEYDGPGYYGRKSWEGRTAEFVYSHIGNPSMLLWLAEAAGIPKRIFLPRNAPRFPADQIAAVTAH